jgi:hypothetical protein
MVAAACRLASTGASRTDCLCWGSNFNQLPSVPVRLYSHKNCCFMCARVLESNMHCTSGRVACHKTCTNWSTVLTDSIGNLFSKFGIGTKDKDSKSEIVSWAYQHGIVIYIHLAWFHS